MKTFIDKFRASPWLLIAVLTATLVGVLYPHQLGVLLWSLTKLAFGAYLGYWVDRSIFYYGRPGDFLDEPWQVSAAMMLRRAIIIAAAMLALGLGV